MRSCGVHTPRQRQSPTCTKMREIEVGRAENKRVAGWKSASHRVAETSAIVGRESDEFYGAVPSVLDNGTAGTAFCRVKLLVFYREPRGWFGGPLNSFQGRNGVPNERSSSLLHHECLFVWSTWRLYTFIRRVCVHVCVSIACMCVWSLRGVPV